MVPFADTERGDLRRRQLDFLVNAFYDGCEQCSKAMEGLSRIEGLFICDDNHMSRAVNTDVDVDESVGDKCLWGHDPSRAIALAAQV